MVRVGILGCGLQGLRRARAVKENGDELVVVADIDRKRADLLSVQMGCKASNDWQEVVSSKDIDAVIVCSPNNLHAPMSIAALQNGKNVLCEKPLACNSQEAKLMVNKAVECNLILKCGYNLRHHPAIMQAKKWLDEGVIGQLSYLRCRYGNCGRAGYENDWRGNPTLAGGGELLDQGIHVVDLFRWFAGEFVQATGFAATTYWNVAPLEDNVFALLRTSSGKIGSLHVSWTQWRNLFSLEIFGTEGYCLVEGLGGSYGTEKAILGKRSFTEPFKEETIEYRNDDKSWLLEWQEFVNSIETGREPLGNSVDGLEALKLVEAIYKSNKVGQVTNI